MRDDRRLNGVDKDEPQIQPPCKRFCKSGSGTRTG
jgi:hypothetical protein